MNNELTATNPTTQIQCPACRDRVWAQDCFRCGGSRWVNDPFAVPSYQLTINPPPTETLTTHIYKEDPELRAFLTRLEEKLDRLLAALEDES